MLFFSLLFANSLLSVNDFNYSVYTAPIPRLLVRAEVRASYLITLECWREERKVGKTELGDQASVGCKVGTPLECTFQRALTIMSLSSLRQHPRAGAATESLEKMRTPSRG